MNPLPTEVCNGVDYAAWFSAFGTVGAFLIAFWLLGLEVMDRRKRHQAAKERIPRKVSGWCDTEPNAPILSVQNLAEEPVYDVVAYVGKMFTNLEVLPEPEINEYMEVVFGVVPPGKKLDSSIEDRNLVCGRGFPDIPEVAVEFTDARGLHWRRLSNGAIKSVPVRRPFD